MSRSEHPADAGFSVVELFVVVAILGSLLTVAALAMRTVAHMGLETACEQERRVVTTAVEAYLSQYRIDRLAGLPSHRGDEFERGLVSAAVIDDMSTFYDVSTDGSLVPETGSPCS